MEQFFNPARNPVGEWLAKLGSGLIMMYVTAAESGAIVDITPRDWKLLCTVCQHISQAVEIDHIPARTGYTDHAYRYLLLWMSDNRPDLSPLSARQQEADAFLKDLLGSPTANELLLATKIGDSDTPTVRWKFNRDALLMFDVAIREVLDYHGNDDLPFWELPIVTGFYEEDFRALQQEITGILAAIQSGRHRAHRDQQ